MIKLMREFMIYIKSLRTNHQVLSLKKFPTHPSYHQFGTAVFVILRQKNGNSCVKIAKVSIHLFGKQVLNQAQIVNQTSFLMI